MSERRVQKMYSRGSSLEWDSVEMDRYWKPVFDKYDLDKDGYIPLVYFKTVLKSSDEFRADFPDEVINEVLEWADINSDGRLSYDEFLRMIYARELGEARPRFQRFVRFAALTVVPRSQQAITVRRYFEEYNCYPPPIFLLLISLVEIGVFIYYCVQYQELSASRPVPIESPLIYNPYRRYEAWRYLTYMLIHAGGVHIFFNLLIQLILGIPLEMVHKGWRVMLVYVGGVIAGSLGSSLVDPGTYLAGASGGVYALISAHLANVIINFKEMTFGWIRLIGLLIFGGTDIGVALYSRYVENEKNRTSYAAHFAGALAGLMIGLVCLRNLRVHKWEKILGWVLFAVFVLLMLFAILWNIFATSFYPVQKYN
ncbi:rhomboid-related protein 2 [Parasteatoda tepidariorum]|uniref:rhomboid-related protein 2 n=1 Tax=Parasteatoda tepidariorum TaxID=114398 RepID=UPI00077F9568|nr:rhomboid-related protein 2 [Parasteatoda tepidariorum]